MTPTNTCVSPLKQPIYLVEGGGDVGEKGSVQHFSEANSG